MQCTTKTMYDMNCSDLHETLTLGFTVVDFFLFIFLFITLLFFLLAMVVAYCNNYIHDQHFCQMSIPF